MLGAIAGDVIGSRYEFSRVRTKDFSLFPEGASYTDDTILTAAVADCLINDKCIVECLRAWPRLVRIDTTKVNGYGQRFARWVAAPTPQPPYGSYGNGGAMRVSPVAWVSPDLAALRTRAIRITEVTHNHFEGLTGALATAEAIWLCRQTKDLDGIRARLMSEYGYKLDRTVDEVRSTHVYNETSQGCVPDAIICAFAAEDFEDAVRNAVSLGGDADTLAAIAGSIAEARFGIPHDIEREVRSRLDARIIDTLDAFQSNVCAIDR